jgi:hypothetical protein
MYKGLNLGPLPVDRINRTIGTALLPGKVTVSKIAHEHIAVKHPLEYAQIMAVLPGLVANPAFIGRDPAHPHAFYLVDSMEVGPGSFAMVAIAFARSKGGTYKVASAYGLKASQLTSRVKTGRVVPLLP